MKLTSLSLVLTAGVLSSAEPRGVRPTIAELASQIQDPVRSSASSRFPDYYLQVPVDHFHNDSLYEPHSNGTFGLRYWFDATHDRGGPVFVLAGGETSGKDRIPFLETGLIAQLAELTGGIAVVLEHRYYGTSVPTKNLSTENLRFLTTQQAMADTAYFASNVVYKGLEDQNVTAADRPYILYGGSYAGAFVAFLRKLYPEIFWGAIASSAVTEAIYDYWEYFEPIIEYGQPDCIEISQKIISIIDTIIDRPDSADLVEKMKTAWQLGGVSHVEDFLNVLTIPMGSWQSKNWDPEVGSPEWDTYCAVLTNKSISYPSTGAVYAEVRELIVEGGMSKEIEALTIPIMNHIGFLNSSVVSRCWTDQDECFSSFNSTFYQQDSINDSWRLWPYQYCTQWGYLQTGSGVPDEHLPIISRHIDLNFSSIICREAFNVTGEPDLASINQYGGFDLSYDRLAFIDGEQDPWRPATPHAKSAKGRKSTTQQPFLLIKGGVHHWDENGVAEESANLPPKSVKETQTAEKAFIVEWYKEWKKTRETARQDENVEL